MVVDPEAQESFIAILRRSGLIEESLLTQLLDEFAKDESHPFGHSITSLTTMFVTRKLLTNWQIAKLREGKYKGFFLDDLLLLDYLASSRKSTTYLAHDRKRNLLCKVNILRPSALDSPTIHYELEDI